MWRESPEIPVRPIGDTGTLPCPPLPPPPADSFPSTWTIPAGTRPATVPTVSAAHRPGLSRLAPDDATPYGGAFGLTGGEVVSIGGRAGRVLDVDGAIVLVYGRADDVLVRISSSVLDVADVLSFAEGLAADSG